MKKEEQAINDLLREIKSKTGYNQEEIAKAIGYNRSYISQAKRTDSAKLYAALLGYSQKLDNITITTSTAQKIPRSEDMKVSLERSIENLTQNELSSKAIIKNLTDNELRNTAIIERLVTLLEKQFSSGTQKEADRESKRGVVDTQAAKEELLRTGRTGPFSLLKNKQPVGSSKKTGK
jgi:transcriptional regulator with XRE-family HTH domain